MSESADPPSHATRPTKRYVGVGPTVVLLVILGSATLLLLGALFTFWPPGVGEQISASYLGLSLSLDRNEALLVSVAIAGAVGGMGHVLRSFYRYAGERKLVWSWVASYVLIPVVGAVLATIVYVVLRAGLIPGPADVAANEYGFVAVALLSGMFSSQAAEKLKEVFETLFAKPEAGSDSLVRQPVLTGFEPSKGKVGATVRFSGSGLGDVDVVEFGGGVMSDAEFDGESGVLSTTVPVGAETGQLTVRSGDNEARSAAEFEIET